VLAAVRGRASEDLMTFGVSTPVLFQYDGARLTKTPLLFQGDGPIAVLRQREWFVMGPVRVNRRVRVGGR
jgi:hypothetical protein